MRIYKKKCDKCQKIIEGISEKEVSAWLEQHEYYAHIKNQDEGK